MKYSIASFLVIWLKIDGHLFVSVPPSPPEKTRRDSKNWTPTTIPPRDCVIVVRMLWHSTHQTQKHSKAKIGITKTHRHTAKRGWKSWEKRKIVYAVKWKNGKLANWAISRFTLFQRYVLSYHTVFGVQSQISPSLAIRKRWPSFNFIK